MMLTLAPLLLLGSAASSLGADASSSADSRKKVLFLGNSERGLSNVLLASSHAMLVDHPEVDVHFASFASLEQSVRDVSQSALALSPDARPIQYENISGLSYAQTLGRRGFAMEEAINHPGLFGFSKFLRNLELYLVPWSGPEYVQIYYDLVEKINRIDPDVIALDTMLAPGLDATRDLDRKHVMISANQLKDTFAQMQPRGEMFWKIPAMNSAYTYPVPWYLIPSNILLNIRLIYSVLWTPTLSEKKAYIKSQGLQNPINFFTSFREDVPWISPSVEETEQPLLLPDNVVCTGPIFLDQGDVASRDPDLAAWLRARPTIYINLGSHVDYDEADAVAMIGALHRVLAATDAQVLWKFNKRRPYSDDFLEPVQAYVRAGRIRLERWIAVDPAAVLRTGDVAVFVHHGGANSFYEGLAMGVPTVVLPMWVDLYDYAIRSEWLGVGLWGSRTHAPFWGATELADVFMRLLDGSDEARRIAARAKEVGELVTARGGRHTAAQAIFDYTHGLNVSVKRGGPGETTDREL